MLQQFHTVQGDLWRAGLRGICNNSRDSLAYAETERVSWCRILARMPQLQAEPYSVPISKTVAGLVEAVGAESILELSPGWGNYTGMLADLSKRLVCVDSLPHVLTRLKTVIEAPHLETVCSKWEDCQPPLCDVSFAYNCFYQMTKIEQGLSKLNNCADKLCIIGMNRIPEQPFLPDLAHELSLPLSYTSVDMRQVSLILAEMGILAHHILIPNMREYSFGSWSELLFCAKKYIQGPFAKKDVMNILRRYYHQKNGKVVCHYNFASELLYWQPI